MKYAYLLVLNQTGGVVWYRAWSWGGIVNIAVDLVLDEQGNVYVVGDTSTSLSTTSIAIVKFNKTGNATWSGEWGKGGAHVNAVRAALLSTTLYVVGWTEFVDGYLSETLAKFIDLDYSLI